MSYKTANLNLAFQSIAGVRHWTYQDTGSGISAVVGAGFFTDGYNKGMRVGDSVTYHGGTGANRAAWQCHVTISQDTGDTQTTIEEDTT